MSAKSLNRPKSGYTTVVSTYKREKSPDTERYVSKFSSKRSKAEKELRPETAPYYSYKREQSAGQLRPDIPEKLF